MYSKYRKNESGQSLLEVIIAISVGILVVTALTVATIFSLRNAQFAKNSAQATKLAQEGIEKIRSARDRNALIINLPASPSNCPISGSTVTSWNGNATGASIWNCKLYFAYGSGGAYFKLGTNPLTPNDLTYILTFNSAEDISPVFKRAVVLQDTAGDYDLQKTVTVIVQWSDFSGSHESRLTTILSKL